MAYTTASPAVHFQIIIISTSLYPWAITQMAMLGKLILARCSEGNSE
jgi:hypothetical protein